MSKYDNVTVKEYMKKKLEMLNDLGRTSGHCNGILCDNCPLSSSNNKITDYGCHSLELLYPEKAFEIVMNYEPKVDWTKVPVDTKILVKDYKDEDWKKDILLNMKMEKFMHMMMVKVHWTVSRYL